MDKKFPPRMIDYIDSIIQHGSFTQAAKALYISQPYLTQSIQKIEDNLGITVIDRKSKPLRLTETGRVYYQQLHNLIKQMNQAEKELLAYSHSFVQDIRVGILSSLGTYLLPFLLPDFMAQYAFSNFEIKEQLPTSSERDLTNNEIDFYIGQTPERVNITFEKKVSGKHYYYIIIPRGSRFYVENETIITERTFQLEELLKEKFVLTKQGSAIRKQIDELFYKYRLEPTTTMESENIYTVADLARKGAGLTIVPKSILRPIEDFSGYNLYRLPVEVISLQYFIAYLSDKVLSPLEEHFIDFFIEKMENLRI